MSDYKTISQALENARLYSEANNMELLLEATKRAQRLAELEIGPVDLNHPEGVNRAILVSIFPNLIN